MVWHTSTISDGDRLAEFCKFRTWKNRYYLLLFSEQCYYNMKQQCSQFLKFILAIHSSPRTVWTFVTVSAPCSCECI